MRAIVFILSLLSMVACQKDKTFVYKANYTTPNGWVNGNHTIKSITTNFFHMDVKDSASAVNWYRKTDAYAHAMDMGADSLWITYECTGEEWKERERQGMAM